MRGKAAIVWLGIIVLALSASTTAMGSVPPATLGLSPYPSPYQGEIIEVPPGDIETLYFHIDDGGLGGWYHVVDISFHYTSHPAGAGWAELIDPIVQVGQDYQASQWYPFGVIQVDGPPSTMIDIQIDLTLQEPNGWTLHEPIGPIWSNTITKHITPEPSSMLALGTGLFGLGGLLLRRRRS